MAKAIGDPARAQILRALVRRTTLCDDIVAELPLTQSAVSQHLEVF